MKKIISETKGVIARRVFPNHKYYITTRKHSFDKKGINELETTSIFNHSGQIHNISDKEYGIEMNNQFGFVKKNNIINKIVLLQEFSTYIPPYIVRGNNDDYNTEMGESLISDSDIELIKKLLGDY